MTDRRKASIPAPNAVKPEPSTSQEQSEQRPKRSIIRKSFQGEIYGLCWREENELQKALLASLNDRRRVSADLDSGSNVYRQYAGFVRVSRSMPPSGSSSSTGTYVPRSMPPSSSSSSTGICTRRNAASSQSGCSSAVTSRSTSVDEGIKMEPPEIFSPPLKLTHVKQENKSTKVHAQRKFASNSSLPSTPCASPSKSRHPGQAHVTVPAVFPKTAKTEDFLTFLCLRGSSLLPPHLDFGYPRQDRPLSPRQSTASRSGTTRESTPDVSSSSESDEFTNIRTLKSVHTPLRKAARACASTPETARGLASVQPRSPSKTAKRSPHKGVMKSRKALLVSPVQKQMDRFRTKLHAPLSTRFRRRGLSPEYSSQSVCSSVSQHCPSPERCKCLKRKQCRKQKPDCSCTLICTATRDSRTNLHPCSSNQAWMSQCTKAGCVDQTAALYSALHGTCSSLQRRNLSSNFPTAEADGVGNRTLLVRCSLSSDLSVNYHSPILSPAYSDSCKVLSVSSTPHTMCADRKSMSSLSHISSNQFSALAINVNAHHTDSYSKPSQMPIIQSRNVKTSSLMAKYPETRCEGDDEITYVTDHAPIQGGHSLQSWVNSELLPTAVTGHITRNKQDSNSKSYLAFTSERLKYMCHIVPRSQASCACHTCRHQSHASCDSILLNDDVLWASVPEPPPTNLTHDVHLANKQRIDQNKSMVMNTICSGLSGTGDVHSVLQIHSLNYGLDLHTELFNGEFRGLDNADYIAADAEEMLSEHAYTQFHGQTDNNLLTSQTSQRLSSHYAVEKPYALQHILSGSGECPRSKTDPVYKPKCLHAFPELHTPLMANQCSDNESSLHDPFVERGAPVPRNTLDTNTLPREHSIITPQKPAYSSLLTSKGFSASRIPRECFQTTNLPGFRGWPNTGGCAGRLGMTSVSVGCNNRLLPAYKCALQNGLSLSPLPPTLVSVIPIVCNVSSTS